MSMKQHEELPLWRNLSRKSQLEVGVKPGETIIQSITYQYKFTYYPAVKENVYGADFVFHESCLGAFFTKTSGKMRTFYV